jgi:hypothetical protein
MPARGNVTLAKMEVSLSHCDRERVVVGNGYSKVFRMVVRQACQVK